MPRIIGNILFIFSVYVYTIDCGDLYKKRENKNKKKGINMEKIKYK